MYFLNTVYSDKSELYLYDETIVNSKLPFKSKDVMKKLLKITEIATLLKRRIVSKLSKTSIPNFNSTNLRLE